MSEERGENRLRKAMRTHPVFFEPTTPWRRWDTKKVEEHIREITRQLDGVKRLDAVNVPELVDENHVGKPFYRSGDVCGFAKRLGERVGREAVVNKVVVHLQSATAFQRWLKSTLKAGVKNVVLVGGSSNYIRYPGPTVVRANRIAKGILQKQNGLIGNITIPQRKNEARRVLDKTIAGADFFTTQILFSAYSVQRLLIAYDSLCKRKRIKPATVLLSFAPVADENDVEFLRWLGAEFSEKTERDILNGGGSAEQRSTKNAIAIWKRVSKSISNANVSVPVGVNVEQITQHMLHASIDMLDSFARIL